MPAFLLAMLPIEAVHNDVVQYLVRAKAVEIRARHRAYREKIKQGAAQTRVLLNNKLASYMLP
jgi:hypothetical protein